MALAEACFRWLHGVGAGVGVGCVGVCVDGVGVVFGGGERRGVGVGGDLWLYRSVSMTPICCHFL